MCLTSAVPFAPRPFGTRAREHENADARLFSVCKLSLRTQHMGDDELAARLASLLERIANAERRAAEQQVVEDKAESERRAVISSLTAVEAERKAAQNMCRTLQKVTAELESSNETIAKRVTDERGELTKKTNEFLAAAEEQVKLRKEAHEKAVLEDNETLATRMEQMEQQREASEKHWKAELHMKDLEERLLVMRLEEADSKLRDALLHQRSSAEFAEEVRSLRKCEKQWTELETALARTDEAVAQHDSQVASVTAEAEALEAECKALTAKLARTQAKRAKVVEQTLPELAARLAAVEAEQQQVKDECRTLHSS